MRKTLIIVSQSNRNINENHSHCEGLQQLNDLKCQKRLTSCLELLEQRGVVGDVAIFILSQVGDTWLSLGSSELKKFENQRGLR